jgi:hypothetical protein
MLFRFAVIVTILELGLTAVASVLVTYTEPPPGFATEGDLRDLGLKFSKHENRRWVSVNAPCYDTRATLLAPDAALYVSLRTDALKTDYEFRRSREEVWRDQPDRGEVVLINEPIPGEEGYAVRHRGAKSVRFELVRHRRAEMLIVRVTREAPYDTLPAAELSRCERRARVIQEHLMAKMRWREP